MRMIYRAFLYVIFLALLPACWQSKIEKKSGLVIVNVLDKALYDDCHIKGSIHIPFEMIENEGQRLVDKDAHLVIYCSNYQCTSSEHAAKKLKKLGFADVAVYEGGMAEWYQRGLPVEGACKQPYLQRVSTRFPSQESSEIPVVTADELAARMGLSK